MNPNDRMRLSNSRKPAKKTSSRQLLPKEVIDSIRAPVDLIRNRGPLFESLTIVLACGISIAVLAFFLGGANSPGSFLQSEVELADSRKESGIEVLLGTFKVANESVSSNQNGETATKYFMVEMELAAVVWGKVPQARSLYEASGKHERRIRERIEETVRAATQDEWNEPSLKKLRLRLKNEINELLGKHMVDDISIGEFRRFRIEPTANP